MFFSTICFRPSTNSHYDFEQITETVSLSSIHMMKDETDHTWDAAM